MPFSLFLATKYLKPKRSWMSVITIFSVLGVVLGIAVIIIVRAVMTGFGDMWREKILSFKPHISISSFNGVIHDDEYLKNELLKIDGIVAASPSVQIRVLTEFQHNVNAPIVIGIEEESLLSLHPDIAKNLVEGEISFDDDKVLIGIDMAQSFGLRIGDKMRVYSPMNLVKRDEMLFPEEVEIGGIFQMGQRDFDSNYILTSIGFARDLVGLTTGAYTISIKTSAEPESQAFFSIAQNVKSTIQSSDLIVRTWRDVDRELFNALAVEKNMMMLLNLFTSIVAMFCVTVTLIVATVQKRQQIGILKAIGFPFSKIMGVFLIYGWIICTLGVLLGVLSAYGILHNLQSIVDFIANFGIEVFPKSIYGLDKIPWRIHPNEVLTISLLVIFLSTISALIPAYVAAKKDPMEALRG